MPFTCSIVNGLAFGFTSYQLCGALTLLTGRARQMPWIIWLVAVLFLFKFLIGIGGSG